jgi:hypothetical protein
VKADVFVPLLARGLCWYAYDCRLDFVFVSFARDRDVVIERSFSGAVLFKVREELDIQLWFWL